MPRSLCLLMLCLLPLAVENQAQKTQASTTHRSTAVDPRVEISLRDKMNENPWTLLVDSIQVEEVLLFQVNYWIKMLCEKPIALDLIQADEMIRICRERGVTLAIGHQRRFARQHQHAKELLAQGVIGELRHVIAECPPDILRAGIHCADMLLDYVGPIARVTASLSDGRGGKVRPPREASLSTQSADKDSWIFVETANGLQVTLRVTNRISRKAKLTFLSEKGVIEVWWDGGLRYRRSQDNSWSVPDLPLNPYLDEFYFEIDSILSALASGTSVAVPGEAGRNSLEVVLAILIANNEERTVSLPLPQDAAAQYDSA